ncbi:MAG: pilus assembly protein PilM [Candidatus Omnitrophica bacterium]|nr:pilus assembly protein PilM [Candidatus Omnitrophota bacterium]MCK5259610.1 pilus assembly protein PilM [Candidatus Omnitrophota bacterium]
MALSFLKPSKKTSTVVEIGNDWLKILEYSPSHRGGCVTRASFVKLVQIKEPVTEALVKAFKSLKLSKENVIACIPRHLVTVRILEFPSVKPKEINDMVTLQVGKQTPYSREEIIFAYRSIHTQRGGYTKVMLVIARRNIVNARVEVLQKAGIEVEKVAVSSEGVYNWFSVAYASELKGNAEGTVLLDVDSNYSDFMVMHQGQFYYTRNILVGANHLIEEEDKWRDKFVEEVSHSMELYHNEERNIKLGRIFISGAAKNINNLSGALSEQLNLPVTVAEALNNIKIRGNVRAFRDDDCVFVSPSPLLGMAIKSEDLQMDLTSNELRIQKEMEQKRKQITLMGILAASVVLILSLLLLVRVYFRNTYLAQTKKEISKIEKVASYVENMRRHIYLVEGRLDAKRRSINVLHEVHKLTPKEIYFTNINIEEGKQSILQGRAKEMSNVFSFVTILENSPYFENVKTTYATTKKDRNEEYTKFEIICMYEKEEEFEE